MTELEKQLLTAFEALQSAYEQQHQEWQAAYGALQTMYERTSAETAALQEQVQGLRRQVDQLSAQVLKWASG